MIKQTTLKSTHSPDGCPADPETTTMIGRLPLKSHLLSVCKKTHPFLSLIRKGQRQGFRSLENKELTFVSDCFRDESNAVFDVFLQRLPKTPDCPDVPYLLIKLKSLIQVVLPRQLFKAIPGSFIKQWLHDWYLKVIDDFIDIFNFLERKMAYYEDAYFNWMENFMEMEYKVQTVESSPENSPGGFLGHIGIKNYSNMASSTGSFAVTDVQKKLAGSFEKILIAISRIVNPKPELQMPELEIVSSFEVDQSEQADESSVARFSFPEMVRRFNVYWKVINQSIKTLDQMVHPLRVIPGRRHNWIYYNTQSPTANPLQREASSI